MAITCCAKPAETDIAANAKLSAMVEQAPYSPISGILVLRMEKLVLIH